MFQINILDHNVICILCYVNKYFPTWSICG